MATADSIEKRREYMRVYLRKWNAENPERKRALHARWRKANPEKFRASQRKWWSANKEKVRERQRAYAKKNPDKIRARYRRYRDKNPDQFRAHRRKLKGLPEATRPCPELCECCGGPPTGRQSLHLDHDHETGAFRGWLCSVCNTAIGLLGDNLKGAQKAVTYLSAVSKPLTPT